MHAGDADGKCQVPHVDPKPSLWDSTLHTSSMPPPTTAAPPASPRSHWPWAIALLVLTAMILGAGLWVFHKVASAPAATLDRGVALVKELGQQAATVAQGFQQQTVREEFLSSSVKLTGLTRLQVATLEEHETFRRKESDSLAWGLIPLPAIVVQADVPVEYSYYLDFNGSWEFSQADGVVTAYPPPIQPNTPAADISKLTFYTLSGHVWQDDKAVRERLQGTLTPILRTRAAEHVPLVREIARRQVQTFVEKWLADSFSDGREFHVKVLFPEERPHQVSETPAPAPKPAPKPTE